MARRTTQEAWFLDQGLALGLTGHLLHTGAVRRTENTVSPESLGMRTVGAERAIYLTDEAARLQWARNKLGLTATAYTACGGCPKPSSLKEAAGMQCGQSEKELRSGPECQSYS